MDGEGIFFSSRWFRKIFKTKKPLLEEREKDSEETKKLQTAGSNVQSLPSTGTAVSKQHTKCFLDSEVRWKRKYDVFVAHSAAQSDIEEAKRLVSFLEDFPCSLRCFLWQRDTCPGGAVFTEFCQAMQNSHLRALLITPAFVKDDWCGYMMHQALSEGPMSNRMIPVIQNLHHSQYPQELKFYYYIDLSKNPHQGYANVSKTILAYMEDLVKNDNTPHSSTGCSQCEFEPEDKLTPSEHGHTGTSTLLEMTQKEDQVQTKVHPEQ